MCMYFAKQTNTGRPPNFDSMCTPISQTVVSLFHKFDPIIFETSTPSIVSVPSFEELGGVGRMAPAPWAGVARARGSGPRAAARAGRHSSERVNTDEFTPPEAGFPFGWTEPEIAQYPKSAYMTCVLARGGPVPIRCSQSAWMG